MVVGLVPAVGSASAAAPAPAAPWPGADVFEHAPVHQLALTISPADLERLRNEPRDFVRARVSEGARTYDDVAVHLKGSVGSFRPLDEKPGFTLDFSRFNDRQRFHGLRRIHLNNSVEDPSYCNEKLGSELFRAAGVPAPRIAHAILTLNGRRLGPYVLKEGFTEDFLSCYFQRIGGELYEPGEGHDLNQRLRRLSVRGPRTAEDPLEPLAQAALEPGPALRWQRLQHCLDTQRFVAFMALEVMLCHRDGYCLARNNFRVYHNPETGRIVFFPHGMDQLLGNAELSWHPKMAGLVARAVLETPEGARQYRACFGSLFTNLFNTEVLSRGLDEAVAQLRPVLLAAEFSDVSRAAKRSKERLAARRRALEIQLGQPELPILVFSNGVAELKDWAKTDQSQGVQMDCAMCDGLKSLHIKAAGETSPSWRTRALVQAGRYRFQGRARVTGAKPLPAGMHHGAGLRIGGAVRQTPDLLGDSQWRSLAQDFELKTASEVEFICELRARAGEAWFELDSLHVHQLP